MYQKIKRYLKYHLEKKSPRLLSLIHKYKTIIKYAISGALAVAANLMVLYLLTEIFLIWYVLSAVFAFLVSVSIGFFLQKYWTFRDNTTHHIKRQMVLYISVGALNLVLGPALLFVVVEALGIWYLLGQVMIMAILAVESYFINRFITFKKVAQYESIDDQH